jgi:hypothetical protein
MIDSITREGAKRDQAIHKVSGFFVGKAWMSLPAVGRKFIPSLTRELKNLPAKRRVGRVDHRKENVTKCVVLLILKFTIFSCCSVLLYSFSLL